MISLKISIKKLCINRSSTILCDLSVFRVVIVRGSYPNVMGHGIWCNTKRTEHISHLEVERRIYWRKSVGLCPSSYPFCFLVDVLISPISQLQSHLNLRSTVVNKWIGDERELQRVTSLIIFQSWNSYFADIPADCWESRYFPPVVDLQETYLPPVK